MLADIAAALKPNEEHLTFAGQALVVRELETAVELGTGGDDGDIFYRLMVRCVFDADGEQVMTDADIPELKRSGKTKLRPLVEAVQRVNGLAEAVNTGKSEPVPA